LNKNIGGLTDLAKKRHGLADLQTPIHPLYNICNVLAGGWRKRYVNIHVLPPGASEDEMRDPGNEVG